MGTEGSALHLQFFPPETWVHKARGVLASHGLKTSIVSNSSWELTQSRLRWPDRAMRRFATSLFFDDLGALLGSASYASLGFVRRCRLGRINPEQLRDKLNTVRRCSRC
jgi:hypothetical protein